MKRVPTYLACAVAATLMAAAMPAYSQGNGGGGGGAGGGGGGVCKFNTSGTVGLNFGPLNPSAATQVFATASVSVGDCAPGQRMVLTIDQGIRGNLTMQRNSGVELIPYSITAPTFSPSDDSGPGVGSYKTAFFTGTVQAISYMDVPAGTYSDTLTITVTN